MKEQLNGHGAVSVLLDRAAVDYEALLRIGRELLLALGENPEREGLLETPRRWADAWRQFIEYDPGVMDTSFEAMSTGQMVVIAGMRVFSMCEHHLLPFWCDVTIGYLPRQKVLGLSKFARIAQHYAHRLQLQERLAEQISEEVQRLVGTPDVAILAKGEHLCMVSRGVRTAGTTATTVMKGEFQEQVHLRQEFFALAGT